MKREDLARREAERALDLLGMAIPQHVPRRTEGFAYDAVAIKIPAHGAVTFAADGETAFVEAMIVVKVPA